MTTDEDLIRSALAVAATAGPRDVPIGAVVIGGVVLALVGIGLGIAAFVVRRRRAAPVAPWPVQQG